MSISESERMSLAAALFVSLANVVPLWTFRFLPLYDYPIWLYETRILREYSNPAFEFWKHYEVVLAPVPNLGFVGITWLLSWFVAYEVAGKLFLTLCVFGLPWSFWYCVRSLSEGRDNTLGYVAFPFAFNLYFYMGNSFLLGLVLLFWIVGFFTPRLNLMSIVQWVFLSFVLLTSYLIHALSFGLTVLLMTSIIVLGIKGRAQKPGKLLLALLPSVAALVWYISVGTRIPAAQSTWGLWTFGQNLLKPLFLFVKTWGISSGLLLTLLNVGWLIILLRFTVTTLASAGRAKMLDVRFIFPALICVGLAIFLPRHVLGIDQIGARFALPALLWLLLGLCKHTVQKGWRWVFMGISLFVLLYNIVHFYRTNEQSVNFAEDLQKFAPAKNATCLVHFDWSAWTSIWDVGSSSVNPLFGVPFYRRLSEPGIELVHETSIVRLRNRPHSEAIPFAWGDKGKFVESVIANAEALKAYDFVVLLAEREIAQRVSRGMLAHGFTVRCERDFWTFLEYETKPTSISLRH